MKERKREVDELELIYGVMEVPCAHGTSMMEIEVLVDLGSGSGVSETPDIFWERHEEDKLWHPQEGAPAGWGPGRIVRFVLED